MRESFDKVASNHCRIESSEGLGLCLADGSAFVRRSTANRFFDSIQRADPLQRLPRYRRTVRLFQIVEVTPHVRPARCVLNATIFIELIESRIGIRLQRAAKLFQMLRGMFAFAIGRVGEPNGGRGGVARRTIIANIRPQSPCLGLALARSQHRHRRVIGVQFAGGHHVATQRID